MKIRNEQRAYERDERRLKKERLIRKRSLRIYRRVTIIFLGLMLIAGVFLVVKKDKTYSETENRMLAQKPEFSMDSLISGQFMQDVESFSHRM